MRTILSGKSPALFIALRASTVDQETLQCLTTEVMRWDDHTWIMNISSFYSYWEIQAARATCHPIALWRKLLNVTLRERADPVCSNIISMSPGYFACCAYHPWVALLISRRMWEKKIGGLIHQNGKYGESLWREIVWETWWEEVSILERHLATFKSNGFRPATFRRQCHRLRLAAIRLGFKRPAEMAILNFTGVRKRFGVVIANMWRWTRESSPDDASDPIRTGFPWGPWKFSPLPLVRRCLDYSPSLWKEIEPLLIDDLDRLCDSYENNGKRVTRIDWRLTLENLSVLEIPIHFRNPHDLRRERGEHTTTLLQAEYGFLEATRRAFPDVPENHESGLIPRISGWELLISASLRIPDVVLDIFGGNLAETSDAETLRRLENELPIPLLRFSHQTDWFPEDSFVEESVTATAKTSPDSEIRESLEIVAENRPLYIRHAPLSVEEYSDVTKMIFLESTMNKWWRNRSHISLERTYFKYIDPEGNATWIFRDSTGRWYQHGIFG